MRKRPIHTPPPPTISVKRQAKGRGFFKRLHAVTRGRNQRAATAAAAEDLEEEHSNTRIARGLTIIFGVHIVAIGLYFFHLHFLSSRTDAPKGSTAVRTEPQAPLIGPQDRKEMIARGDTYATIAARVGVDEESLRVANNNCSLNAGNQIVIPAKRITAQLRPEIEALRNPAAQPSNQAAAPSADDGLVDASPVVTEPTGDPVLVRPRPNEEPAPRAIPVDNPPTRPQAQQANNRTPKTAKSYTVRNGDSLWGIAKRHKVEQAALMKANGITDPKKLRSGMTLKIPE